MTLKPTSGVWRCKQRYQNGGSWCVYGPVHQDGGDYAPVATLGQSPEDEANAHLIVQAVNSRADLLATATRALDYMPSGQPETRLLQEAIAKASPQAPGPAHAAFEDLLAALERSLRLFNEALPKFNWDASALDANAITLLNQVPGEVSAAIAKAKATSPQAR